MSSNLKWILLILLVIVGSNLLTHFGTLDSFGKKEQRKYQVKYDSLSKVFLAQEIIHLAEKEHRRKIFSKDSLDKIALKNTIKQDSILKLKQAFALHKYDKLFSKQALTKLDSAYEADNH